MDGGGQDPAGDPGADGLAERLRTLARGQQKFAVTMARRLDLSPSDVTALEYLLSEGPLGPVELGQRLGMTSASATTLVDRLEAAGHVDRRPHPTDRRRLVVVPTGTAGALAYGAGRPMFEGLERAAADLSPAERAVVARYLDRAIAVLRAFNEEPSAR